MRIRITCFLLIILTAGLYENTLAQSPSGSTSITGNFEINSQYYQPDSAIDAPKVNEKFLNNSFLNLNLTSDKFSAGLRYESYLNPLLGFDSQYKGSGIPYRFARFNTDGLQVTAGNFYDQFGSGMIFRSYEERSLGIDNAMDGIHAIYKPVAGVTLKGFVGRQRTFFRLGPGIVRGADADVQLNDIIPFWKERKLRIGVGGSFVSKYQEDDVPSRILPENVGAAAGRINLNYGKFAFDAEYAYKANDPATVNNFIYKNGEALYINAAYTKKGLGVRFDAKRIDNMNFRSDRAATGNNLNINYLPAITKQYTYRLTTLYPYATQPNGEMGGAGEIYYTLQPKTKLGGTYGTNISLNASVVNDIKRSPASNDTLGYKSDFLAFGKEKYYQDLSLEITRKFTKKSKLILSYVYQFYNKNKIEGKIGEKDVTANTVIADYLYKINNNHSIRIEGQHLFTQQDKQNWAMMLVEYSISPHWSFTAFDEWNYGNKKTEKRFHYYTFNVAYNRGGTRLAISYARQREGLLCVGGVCRFVPASNGVNLTITSRF